MNHGLPPTAVRRISVVFSRYPQVEQAILYGSRAKGTYKRGSDIDLTLRGEGLTLNLLYQILDELDNLFLPYTLDVSLFNSIHDAEVLDHIQRVGVPLYQRGEALLLAA